MAIYIILYIVFTCIYLGISLRGSEKLSKFDWFIVIIFGWIASPIIILIVFGKLIRFLDKYYG